MTFVLLVILGFGALSSARQGARLARRKHRPVGEGLALGLLLGPLGVWMVRRMPKSMGRVEREQRDRDTFLLIAGIGEITPHYAR